MSIAKSANLALSFLLELCMLAALGYWGFVTGSGPVVQGLLCTGLPIGVAALWGVWLAPASPRRLSGPAHLAAELILFGLAIAALFAAGQALWGALFLAVYAINVSLRLLWRQ